MNDEQETPLQQYTFHTPETNALEEHMEELGRRDVPVRVYQQMRVFEDQRNHLQEAIDRLVEEIRIIENETRDGGQAGMRDINEMLQALLAQFKP